MDVRAQLKKLREWWDLVGFLWPALAAVATFAFAWLSKMSAVVQLAMAGAASLTLICVLTWRLAKTARTLKKARVELADKAARLQLLEHYLSGQNWPAEDCLKFELDVSQDGYAAILKGASASEAGVDVDFDVVAHVVCHLPVTIRQFDLTVTCIGPGVTAAGPYIKLTGWDRTLPKGCGQFRVKTRLEGKFGLESGSGHARLGVEGNVVVSSPLWNGEDRFVPLRRLSEHCVLLNEIPEGRRLLPEVAQLRPSKT